MNKIKSLAASAAIILATAGAASAVPVTINFDALSGAATTFTVGDVTVGADNFDVVSNPSGAPVNIRLDGRNDVLVQSAGGQGLGVLDPGDSNNDIDGNGDNNILTFTFDSAVRLVSVLFDNVDDSDEATLAAVLSGPTAGTTLAATQSFISPVGGDDGTLSPNLVGTFFGIGAIDGNDDFRVRSITVETDIAPVPLPAGLPLLAVGLGGLALLRRRRKS